MDLSLVSYHAHVGIVLFSISFSSSEADYGIIRTLCNGCVKIYFNLN